MSAYKDIASTETLSAYLDDELPAEKRTALEKHLAESPETRRRLDALRHVVDGLHALEPPKPPPTLERFVVREVGLERERLHWLRRMEGSFSLFSNPQNPILIFFALIVALAIFVYLFSVAVERDRQTDPVFVPAAAEGHVVGERLEVAGRVLFWGNDDAWHERGVGGPRRDVDLSSDAGREWLSTHPELAPLAELDEPVVIAVDGEVVRLVSAALPELE